MTIPFSLEQESFFGPDPVLAPNVAVAYRLAGPLNLGVLRRASFLLLERHEGLRFRLVEGQPPAQLIAPPAEIDLDAEAVQLEWLGEHLAQASRIPLDLYREGPLRIRLYRIGHDDHVFSVTAHPSALDAWGTGIFNREFWALYRGLRSDEQFRLPSLPLTFTDHVRRQHDVGSQLTPAQRGYYRQQLDDLTHMPLPWQHGEQPGTLLAHEPFTLDPILMRNVVQAAKDLRVTIAAVFLAAFQLALAITAGTDGGGLSCIYLGRDQAGTEGMAAAIARRVPLRFETTPATRLGDFIQQTMQAWAIAVSNSAPPYSSSRLVRALGGRADSLEPVFNLRVAGRAGAAGSGRPSGQPELRVSPVESPHPRPIPMWPQFGRAALFALVTLGARPAITPIYDSSQVPESVARPVFASYRRVVSAVADGQLGLTASELSVDH